MFTGFKFIFGILLLLQGTAHAGLFSDDVDLGKLPHVVDGIPEFAASGVPRIKEATYSDKVISFAAENVNASAPSLFEEKLSYIKNAANNIDNNSDEDKVKATKRARNILLNLVSYGTNVNTLGGMFNLGFQYSEVVTPGLKIKAESKAVKEIKGVDGILFPLKVGNALFFTYTYLNSQDKFGVTFEVKEKVLAQKFVKDHPEIKDLNLIGDIYLISKESQSTNDNIHIDPCELYFSDELSYVIGGSCADKDQWMKSYKLTKAGIAYREEVTALNKAREQEALDKKIRTSAQLTPEMKAKGKAKFTQAFQLFQTNEFEAAVIRFNQGLEIDPANGVGHYYLAETYSRLNDNENAMEHYRYTFVFEPDIKEAPIAQVKYEKLKATLGK